MDYFRRDGSPYATMLDWAVDYEHKDRRVASTTLEDGTWVSTVWLGLNHNFRPDAPPLIFETMAFPNKGNFDELWCERYSTEAEALAGHERICVERPWQKDNLGITPDPETIEETL